MTESYDEAIEALRKKLNELPRYSFFIDGGGGVVRVADNCGRWIEWQSAHEMFDTEFVDCAIAELRVRRAIAKAQAAPKPHWPVPSAPAVPQWQPIETAPKLAGGRVLILKDCGPGTLSSMSIAFWLDDDRWHLTESTRTAESYGYRVTHWMPLPAAPSPTEKKES